MNTIPPNPPQPSLLRPYAGIIHLDFHIESVTFKDSKKGRWYILWVLVQGIAMHEKNCYYHMNYRYSSSISHIIQEVSINYKLPNIWNINIQNWNLTNNYISSKEQIIPELHWKLLLMPFHWLQVLFQWVE
jgi:hypothetical protein